jgi:hypothetical protein
LQHKGFVRTVAAMTTAQQRAQSLLWQSIKTETRQQIIDRIVADAPPLVGPTLSTVCSLTGLLPVNLDPAPNDA